MTSDAEPDFDTRGRARGHSRVRGSGEKRRQVERLRAAPAAPATIACATPIELDALRAWREAAPDRAFSVSSVNGVTLSEVRDNRQLEAVFDDPAAALGAVAADRVVWHLLPSRYAAPVPPAPVIQPKSGGKQNLRKLRERAVTGE